MEQEQQALEMMRQNSLFQNTQKCCMINKPNRFQIWQKRDLQVPQQQQ